MKAVFFDNELKFIDDYPVAEPGENEALVRISMTGICNTDLEITNDKAGEASEKAKEKDSLKVIIDFMQKI